MLITVCVCVLSKHGLLLLLQVFSPYSPNKKIPYTHNLENRQASKRKENDLSNQAYVIWIMIIEKLKKMERKRNFSSLGYTSKEGILFVSFLLLSIYLDKWVFNFLYIVIYTKIYIYFSFQTVIMGQNYFCLFPFSFYWLGPH